MSLPGFRTLHHKFLHTVILHSMMGKSGGCTLYRLINITNVSNYLGQTDKHKKNSSNVRKKLASDDSDRPAHCTQSDKNRL